MPRRLGLIKSLIIDIDGVLWRGEKPLPGVAAFFAFLAAHSIHFLIVTNNATRTAESLVSQFETLNITISPSQILTSAKATALYLSQNLPAGTRLLVVGEQALVETMRRAGFSAETPENVDGGYHARAVVVGLDRGFTYRRLQGASSEIRAGARFVATNTDSTIPAETGLLPGAGAIVAAVQTATAVDPIVIGKPYRPMFDAAIQLLEAPVSNIAMLGDRLDTDIQGAHAVDLTTILVLTGVSTAAQVRESSLKPDFMFADLKELMDRWAEALADGES